MPWVSNNQKTEAIFKKTAPLEKFTWSQCFPSVKIITLNDTPQALDELNMFDAPKNLVSANLVGNQLKQINWSDHGFSFLQTLDLSNNKLEEINWKKYPVNLKSVILNKNEFKSFNWLHAPNSLENISLCNNKLAIFEWLCCPSGLKTIDLSNCELTELNWNNAPVSLTFIGLTNNRLSKFSFLNQPVGITSLDLSKNLITEFSWENAKGKGVDGLGGFKSLNLSTNKLISEGFSWNQAPDSLESINFNNNESLTFLDLKQFPKGMRYLELSKATDLNALEFDLIPESKDLIITWNSQAINGITLSLIKKIKALERETVILKNDSKQQAQIISSLQTALDTTSRAIEIFLDFIADKI